jgi:two-component system, LytTR family, sensor kinase
MNFIRKHRNLDTLAARLPSYKPLNIVIRVFIISIVAFGLLRLIVFVIDMTPGIEETIPIRFYLIFMGSFVIAAEIQIALDNLLERFLPVPYKMKLRLLIQVSFGLIILYLSFHSIKIFIEPELLNEKSKPGMYMGLLTGLLFVYMTANGLTIARFTEKWIISQKQIEEMKRERLKMDYNSLQDQLNPHFLFNNLSVLKSLIIYDKSSALKFTENFTDVYRYVLQSKDKQLVKLKDELIFIDSYLGLHKERLGDGLEIMISVLKESAELDIAPLSLQLLVENAIKHNVAAKESPLQIKIKSNREYVSIENNIQPRVSSYSTKTGLNNLKMRYDILTNRKIEVINENGLFTIKVPLL